MKKISQAVILAGGEGNRLKPFTLNYPKPMLPINRKPFLEYLIELLKKNEIEEVIILVGYLGKKIENYFGDGSRFGIKIKYSYTPFKDKKGMEIESGLRIKNAASLLNNFFLLIYCDNYWPLQLSKLISFFKEKNGICLTTVYTNKDLSTKNNIMVDQGGHVKKYDKNRLDKSLNGVEIGFFIINKKILKFFPKGNFQFERDLLPKLAQKGELVGYLTDQKYYSISDIERAKTAEKFLTPKKVVFLDRDGVINKKIKADYVKRWEEFEFLPGTIEAIRLLNQHDYKIYMVSNQAGIAKGKMSLKDLKNIHKNMLKVLKKQDAKIDGVYFCPHGWDDECDCRKPKPGMLLQASREHLFDLRQAIFIGDDIRDKQAAQAVGCRPIMVNAKKNLLDIVHSLIK